MIQGLRIPQPSSSNVHTSDLLGLASEWPLPIPSEVLSVNPFDSLTHAPGHTKNDRQQSPTQYPPSMASTELSPPSSMESTTPSDASFLTMPKLSNRIHVTHHDPQDRYTFDPGLPATHFPIKVFFLKRFVYRRASGLHGTIFCWHLCLEEAFPRIFHQWQIALQPGEYIFEDFGNSLVIIGQKFGSEPILLSFPIASSQQRMVSARHSSRRPTSSTNIL
jgi:hypothetical protein